jgi:hypothetical protein
MVLEEVSGHSALWRLKIVFAVNYQPLIFLIYVVVTSWDINKKYIIIIIVFSFPICKICFLPSSGQGN